MTAFLGNISIDYLMLVIMRTGGLVMISPIFGRTSIPVRIRLGFAVMLAYVLFVAFPPLEPLVYDNLISYAAMLFKEVIFGLILGFVTITYFASTFVAGQLIDMQIGFGMVNVYDIQNNTQIPMIGNLLNVIMLIVFFAVNAHHNLIYMLRIAMEQVPVGGAVILPDIALLALEVFVMSFVLGVQVALPVICMGLLMEIGMGVLMRSVPQMNMFVVGIPVKIFVGLLLMAFVLPVYVYFCDPIFESMFQMLERMFLSLGGML